MQSEDSAESSGVSPIWSHVTAGQAFVPFNKWFDMPLPSSGKNAKLQIYGADGGSIDTDDFVASVNIDTGVLTDRTASVFENDDVRVVYSVVKKEDE